MAFPTLQTADTKFGTVSVDATSWTLTYPTNIQAGDLILVTAGVDSANATVTLPAGFVVNSISQALGNITVIGKKKAVGTESGSFTMTVSSAQGGGWRVFRITNWEGTLGTTFDNTSNSGSVAIATLTGVNNNQPDPPSLTPLWGSADTLWLALYGNDNDKQATVYPTGFSNTANDTPVMTTMAGLATAWLSSTTATVDPSAYTMDGTDEWGAATVAIRPAGGTNASITTDTVSRTSTVNQPTVSAASPNATPHPAAVTGSGTVGAVTVATTGASLAQPHFRVRSDDSQTLNANTGWAAALDTNVSMDVEKAFRIRFEIASTISTTTTFKLQYRRNAGTWKDIPVSLAPSPTSVDETEAILSAVYANNDATTNVLAGSGLGFVAGVGLESNITPSVTLNNQHTEYEWTIRIRLSWGNGTAFGRNTAGDTFEYRVVEGNSQPFTGGGAYVSPLITVTVPQRLMGGTFIETPYRMGPFKDANGNLYALVEFSEANGGDHVCMLKSSDGGDTWNEAGGSSRPAQNDFECCDVHQVGSTLHIGQFYTSVLARYSQFRTSDHSTNPDTWGITDEVIFTTVAATKPSDQSISLQVRSDGSIVCMYATSPVGADERVAYKIRSPAGVWGPEIYIDTQVGGSFWQGIVVKGASDLCYMLYFDNANDVIWYKTLTSANVLSSTRVQVSTTTVTRAKGIAAAGYYDAAGAEVIVVGWESSGTHLFWSRRIVNGVLQTALQVSDQSVSGGEGGSTRSDCYMAFDDATNTVYAVYSDAVNRHTWMDINVDNGGWGTDIEINNASLWDNGSVNVYTHSAGNGGAKVLGLFYDNGSGGFTGAVTYYEYDLGGQQDALITRPTVVGTATINTPTVTTTGPASPTASGGGRTATVGAVTVRGFAGPVPAAIVVTKGMSTPGLSIGGARVVTLVTQTNTALPITKVKGRTVSLVTQPSTAIAFSKRKFEQPVAGLETDQAFAIVPTTGGGGPGPPPAGDPSIWKVSIYNLNGAVVLDRAPCQSWMFNYVLNAPGAFEANLQLNHASVTEAIFTVGAKEIRIYRGTVLVWGGYLWGIRVSATDYKATIRGEGYFSRLRRRIIADDLLKKDRDQADIAWDLIQYTQSTHGTLGITDGHTPTGVTIDHAYCATDLSEVGSSIEELSEMDNSFDFWITPTITTATNKIFQTAVPRRGATKAVTINQNNAILADYEIDAMDLSNRIWGVGNGECNPADVEVFAAASISTYGELHSAISYDDLDSLPSVKAHTREDLRLNKDPRRQVTVTLEERDYTWGSFDIGDIITLASNRGYITGTRQMRVIRIQTNFDPENRIAFHEIDLDSVIA